MAKGTLAIVILVAGLVVWPAVAQERDVQPQPAAEETPVFRVTVVGRTAKAINFRPRDGETEIKFVGTSLSPDADGEATVEGEDGYIEIDADFDDLESPRTFGPELLTYVLWAITPEGRASNLGELQVSGGDGELRVTTELQAFGLIVTAEPYFAVTRPSNVVVLESAPYEEGVFQDRTIGRLEAIDAKYELLERGSYLMNQDSGRLGLRPIEPGDPLDLAQARNAVALARAAGADRYAGPTFAKAALLLTEAENARREGERGDEVQQPARQAVQTAEDARLIAMTRMEEEYEARQRARAAEREAETLRLQAEAQRTRQEALERARRERERALAEAARRERAEQERLAAEAARLAAERARADAAAAAERLKAEADAAAARLAQEQQAAEAARLTADQARAAAEAQQRQAQAAAEQAEREKAELRERLREQLNAVLETRETARGLIVNVSDVLFDFDSANLKPGARERLARVGGILLTQPGLQIEVEGHTDSVGSDSYNQRLSEERAASVRDYLVRQGIQPAAVATAGFGETQPVVANDSAAGRQQNRRVELVVSGEAIGRTTTTTTETTTETVR